MSRAAAPAPAGAETRPPEAAGLLRPKGNLSRGTVAALGIAALLPLVTIAIRALALPGVLGQELGGLRALAAALNQALSLSAIPPDQRDQVLYLLLFPTCALLVAVARLTFGIRVLGFRSILIAVAFHQSGIVASLLLIAIAVSAIVLLRPWLRRIRLPYYARVSVILGVVATTMIAALLAGPWIRSDIPLGMAYFPVIVLGMLAEGVAHTLDRDNVVAASWRAITTVLLAFLIALVCWIPALRGVMLQFPELVLTQIVAIVMVSEFLDLRLLQNWDAKVADKVLRSRRAGSGPIPVAVVRNRIEPDGEQGAGAGARGPGATVAGAASGAASGAGASRDRPGDAGDAGLEGHGLRSVQRIVDALREGGHPVQVIEGDASLLPELRRFFPASLAGGEPGGIVLNLAHGARGADGATQVPAVLEMAGVAYAGPAPLGHAVASDRVVLKLLLEQAGIRTPRFRVMAGRADDSRELRFPVVVRPRREPGAIPMVVGDRRRLRAAVRRVARRHGQEAVVEERVTGRHVRAALLGNHALECLPLVELPSGRRMKICPAPLDPRLEERIRDIARASFHACGCRDYARVDVRVAEDGEVWVMGVGTLGILAAGGSFAIAGAEAGYSFPRLMCRIVEVALERYRSLEPLSMSPPRAPRRKAAAADGRGAARPAPPAWAGVPDEDRAAVTSPASS